MTLARTCLISTLMLIVATGVGGSPPVEPRDWHLYPAIAERELPADVYAVGDVHGDYERLVELMAAGHLLPSVPATPRQAIWSGGTAVFVVTGDFIDKYDRSLSVIELFRALEPQCAKSGGQLIVTLGNHEAAFLASGGTKKRSAEFVKELKAAGMDPIAVAAGTDGQGVGAWMRSRPVAAKVGDWFFCHAGNTGGRTLEQLRTEVESTMAREGFGAAILADPNSILEARMHPRQWWDGTADISIQDAATPPTPADRMVMSESRLRKSVEALGCKHLVIGHQPGKLTFADGTTREAGQLATKFDGLLYMIDTGMSRGQSSGNGAILKLHRDPVARVTASVIAADGVAKPILP